MDSRIGDVYRPSFLEMIAQERLMGGLQPAVKHVLSVFLRRAPAGLRWLEHYHAEIFHLLLFFIERRYLHLYDGSFAENFHGLKRVRLGAAPPTSGSAAPANNSSTNSSSTVAGGAAALAPGPLGPSDRRSALFFLVFVPYLKTKLDAYYALLTDPVDEEGFENENALARQGNDGHGGEEKRSVVDMPASAPSVAASLRETMQHLKQTFVRFYPSFHAIYEAVHFFFQLRFLFEFSPFFSPWLKVRLLAESSKGVSTSKFIFCISLLCGIVVPHEQLLGQTVQRMTMADIIAQNAPKTGNGPSGGGGPTNDLNNAWNAGAFFGVGIRSSFLCAYCLRCMEYINLSHRFGHSIMMRCKACVPV